MSICPFLKKKCIEGKCQFWTHLLGKNPQSEQVIDRFSCAISELPILLVENAQMSRQTAASVDKVASETAGVKGATQALGQALCNAAQAALEMKERAQIRLMDADHTVDILKTDLNGDGHGIQRRENT